MSHALMDCAREFAAGSPVLIPGGEGVGAYVALLAAEVTPAALGRLGELSGDLLVLAIDESIARRLGVAKAGPARGDGLVLAGSIGAADAIGTGWSLQARAQTIRRAADPRTRRGDLLTPGHVPTACVAPHADTAPALALELAAASGRPPAVVLSAVLHRTGRVASLEEVRRDRRLRGVPVAPADALRARRVAAAIAHEAVECALPTRAGTFRAVGFAHGPAGEVTVALVHGDPSAVAALPVHVRAHCLLGNTFGSRLCGCRAEQDRATAAILAAGAGILLYTKLAADDPFACPQAHVPDGTVVAGLLRHIGAERVRLAGAAADLGPELAALGFAAPEADVAPVAA